ncbi:DUF6380 family protein [Streptomyces sp. NPDC004690]
MDAPATGARPESSRRATRRCRTASLTATAGGEAPAHRGGRTGEGAR